MGPCSTTRAGVHHIDGVRGLAHDAEIVGDHQEREATIVDEIAKELEDLRLRRDVERRSRLVGDEQARLGEQRHRDQDALTHAARQHDGIGPGDPFGVGHAHLPEHLVDARQALRPVPGSAEPPIRVLQDRAHLVADGENRIERGHRVLEHHRHRRAAQGLALARSQAQEIASVEQDRAGDDAGRRRRQNPHDRPHRHALAAAGFADQRHMTMRWNVERDVTQHVRATTVGPEVHAERANRQQRIGAHLTLSTS